MEREDFFRQEMEKDVKDFEKLRDENFVDDRGKVAMKNIGTDEKEEINVKITNIEIPFGVIFLTLFKATWATILVALVMTPFWLVLYFFFLGSIGAFD